MHNSELVEKMLDDKKIVFLFLESDSNILNAFYADLVSHNDGKHKKSDVQRSLHVRLRQRQTYIFRNFQLSRTG